MTEHGRRPDDPSHRYARLRARPSGRAKIATALAGLGLAAWVAWAAFAAATPDVRTQVLDFTVRDSTRVEVSVAVTADPRAQVTCTLRAQNREHATTGLRRVVSGPTAEHRRVLRAVIETRERAVVVTVVGCRVLRPEEEPSPA